MPRLLLKAEKKMNNDLSLKHTNLDNKVKGKEQNQVKLYALLRKKRSERYMSVFKNLDIGGHVHNAQQINAILEAIRSEFPTVEINKILLGIVSKCYLGEPYEVHTLNFAGNIITHFKVNEILPDGMEKARSLALYGGYDFIEVYTDCCRAIDDRGNVSVIKG